MEAELVIVGNEVLAGFTVNTNAAYLGQELFKIGFQVNRQTVLPDKEGVLSQGIQEALKRSSLVIVTGGLGPTDDDITCQVAAKLFASDLVLDKTILNELEQRYGKGFPSLKDQATIPRKALPLKNHVGTAPGLVFSLESSTLILLPGVPVEMKEMFAHEVVPYLAGKFQSKEGGIYQTLNFFNLREMDVEPFLHQMRKENPHVEIGIYPSLGQISVRLFGKKSQLEAPYQKIISKFFPYRFESPSGKLEEAIHEIFIHKGLTLSVAESCTGGSVAAHLTQLPGASEYFLGSIVSYSNALKSNILGVSKQILRERGAVSAEVVQQMAEGVLKLTGSDFSVAVSGIAGPSGGSLEKPVGTVWCAVAQKGKEPYVWKFSARGNRETIIIRSVNVILSQLLIKVRDK